MVAREVRVEVAQPRRDLGDGDPDRVSRSEHTRRPDPRGVTGLRRRCYAARHSRASMGSRVRARPTKRRTGRQRRSGRGAQRRSSKDDPITEVVADRGLGRDRGDRLRGLRRHDRSHCAERTRRSTAASAPPPPAPARRRSTAMAYPATGEARAPRRPHRTPPTTRTSASSRRSAPRMRAPSSSTCAARTSRSCRRSRSRSFAINDAGWLKANIDPAATTQKIVTAVNGTGAVQAERVEPRPGRDL